MSSADEFQRVAFFDHIAHSWRTAANRSRSFFWRTTDQKTPLCWVPRFQCIPWP